ncbi:MAG: TraR/DksA C4-type zinc finger protein [bacterium]|nr:TraR/DksA C4-type zinc finger protein [bacterium]
MATANLSEDFIRGIKEKLLARKKNLEEQLSSFAQADPHQKGNYNSDYPQYGDKEDENASEVAEFVGNLSLEDTLEQSLEMINRSLAKIENGGYGVCEKCGQAIAQERLNIMPTATKCSPKFCKGKNGQA